jgi:cytochrome subunit of sulfide dehydrogenase
MTVTGLCLAIALALVSSPAVAGTVDLPPPGVASCSNCHPAAMANGGGDTLPPLAGRKADDLVAAMTAFRDGSRPATVMGRLARGFSDGEIKAIAAWWAAQPR